MAERHFIEDAEFDISFDSISAAREVEPGLAAFVRERLMPLADEIFCELSGDGMSARIERLEIDLGEIRYSGFRDEMENRFREKLRSLLQEEMRSSAGSRIDRRQAERGQLEVFLETGRMPWHAERSTEEAADVMLARTLAHQGEAFAGFLKKTPHRDVVVKRLARQFPDRLLIDVMQLFAPVHAIRLGELIAEFGATWKKKSAGVSVQELKSLVWERLLGEHLKSGVPDPVRLLRDIVKELFVRHARRGEISGKRASAFENDPVWSADDFMHEAQDAADRRGEKPLAAGRPEEEWEWGAHTARLRALLETSFASGEAGELAERWEELRGAHRELIRAVFMQRMGDARLQQKVAEGFPEPMLAELLSILSPQDSGFMLRLSGLPELRGADGARNAAFWNYTLGYLHVSGPQSIDRADYARGLLRRMAAQGMAQRPLAQAISAIAPELNEVLAGLLDESAPDESALGESARAESVQSASSRADTLYRQLVQRLEGAGGGGTDLAETMAELESIAPATLEALLRRLQAGELRANVGALDAREAGQLVQRLIRLNSGAQESGFLHAVKAQAHQARDPQRYYRHILEKLLRNENVDLEAAATDEGAQEGAQTVAEADAALGAVLSAPQDKRASEREELAYLTPAETGRAGELYRQLVQRLAGAGGGGTDLAETMAELESLSHATLEALLRRLQAGELRANVGALDAREAGQLVQLLIRLNSGAQESGFLRAVAAQAHQARDPQRYYRHILEKLLRNENVDLEAAAADEGAQAGAQTVAEADAALGKALSAPQDKRASEREELARPTPAESGRAGELYRQLVQRLAGASGGGMDLAETMAELESIAPATLEALLRRLQAGELRANVGALDAREAGQLVQLLIRLNSGAQESGFLREIERCALRAKSAAGYYRHILDGLLRNQIIDLETAADAHGTASRREPPSVRQDAGMAGGGSASRQDDTGMSGAERALESGGLLRIRLEEALALGRAESVAGIWGDLLSDHAEMLREVFMRRLGDESLRAKLANGFPESMLYGLIRALAPPAGRDVEVLAMQPEFRASGAAEAKNVPFWAYTLSYLHACGLDGYERPEYANGLVHHLAERGMSRTAMLRAVERLVPSAMSEPERDIVLKQAGMDAADASTETRRADELCRQLLHRLSGQGRTGELAQEIGELAAAWPDAVKLLYRQLQSGEAGLDVTALAAREASLLIAAFLAANHGSMGEDIRREIEVHAGKARDEQRYFQTVLERLIRNGALDLEAAMAAAPHETAEKENAPVRDRAVEKSAPGVESLRARFESALLRGDAGEMAGVWDELRFNHGNLVREIFSSRMGDDRLRKQLAERFSEALLFELMHVLAPVASGFIENLEKRLGRQAGATRAEEVHLAVREHALSYIHAVGARGFRRADYVRELMHRMAAQGMERSVFLRAVDAVDPALATFLSEADSMTGTAPQPAPQAEAARAAALYRQLLHHLSREGRRTERDCTREIAELAMDHPETLERLYRSLQTGELDMDAMSLTAREAGTLAVFFAELVRGGELKRQIETHADRAKDQRSYYRHILNKLIRSQSIDFDAAMNDVQRAPAHTARLRALLETSFASGEAGELAERWEELRGAHRELIRAVFMQRMGDARLQQKVAEGFPEPMLAELLSILSPQDSGFMLALSGLPELRGADGARNAAFWNYTLGYLHVSGPQSIERADYARGLLRRMAAQGMAQRPLAQALGAIAPELNEVFAGLLDETAPDESALEESTSGESTPEDSVQTASSRADTLYRQLVQRLEGASDGGTDLVETMAELESFSPATLEALLRRLQAGELRANVGALDAREAGQLVQRLIRLNSGVQESGFLHALKAQTHQARDPQRYYRHILEKLLRNENVDLDAAAADEGAQAGVHAVDAPAETNAAPRAAYLRGLLDSALSGGNTAELLGAWDEIRMHHSGLVRERFARLMGDEHIRDGVAHGFPASLLAELVRILAPAESGFIETLAERLSSPRQSGAGRAAPNALFWQHALSFLHASANSVFDRRDYAESLLHDLSAQGISRNDVLQAVAQADAALGKALSAQRDMNASGREELARSTPAETGRAGELYRQLVQRLEGAGGGGTDLAETMAELESVSPVTLEALLRRLQAGELRADVGALDAREAGQLVQLLIRLNSGAQESDFLRAVAARAHQARDPQRYYRHILEKLLRNENVDLDAAASDVLQETARPIPADAGGGKSKASQGAGDETGRHKIENSPPSAIAGDKPMPGKDHLSVSVDRVPPDMTGEARPASGRAADGRRPENDSESVDEIYVANAGMVLVAPYFPQLFHMLELTEGTQFKDERAAGRAIHLLQFMVNESCDSPEFLLPLNKLLCGVPLATPILREIEISAREREAIEVMLAAIIRNWTILGNTSVQGLRESFLQRGGLMRLEENGWRLKVETKGVDVLLDRLPWSFSIIRYAWMARPIHVEWR